MIAFWLYDLFPYCLGAEVTNVSGDKVSVKGYEGFHFKPVVILQNEEGLIVKNHLDTLKREYETAQSELLKEYKKKAFEVAPFIHHLK